MTGFIAGFGFPQTLKEAGADQSFAERMTEEAMGDGQMFGNPRRRFEEIQGLFVRLL